MVGRALRLQVRRQRHRRGLRAAALRSHAVSQRLPGKCAAHTVRKEHSSCCMIERHSVLLAPASAFRQLSVCSSVE